MATNCQVVRDPITNDIIKVTAPNGNSSKLFRDINELVKDKEQSLNIYAVAYTPQFTLSFGDWQALQQAKEDDNQNLVTELSKNVSSSVDENGEPLIENLTDSFPTDIQNNMGEGLKSKVKFFLTKVGVNVETANLPKDIRAQADLLNRTIKIANGQEDDLSLLGEEAAHFYVSLLPKDSSLYQDMFNKITNYPIYKDVLASYSKNPNYQINGKPNFTKIKEEAIGKMISNLMINKEGPQSWLSKIMDFISRIFTGTNPFLSSAENILSAKIEGLNPIDTLKEDSIMFSLTSNSTVEQNYDLINDMNNRLTKKTTGKIDPETKRAQEKYFLDDNTEIGKRVTDLAKDFYNNRFGGASRIDDIKRETYNLQAEKGTDIHKDIEDIERRIVNENGTIRAKMLPRTNKPATSEEIYNTLEQNMLERFVNIAKKYGKGTRFLFETKVYDPSKNIAGTIDLLVLKPNGRVDIYDWKSSDFNTKSIKDGIPWWKQDAYTIQLDEYSRILRANYNIQTDIKRAVPIRAIFTRDSNNRYTDLSSIEIGSSVVSTIPENQRYLLPVPSKSERTGVKEVDQLITRLESLHDEIRSRKVSIDEKFIRDQELEKIKKAITTLQVQESLDGIIENGVLLMDNVKLAIDNSALDVQQAMTYYKELLVYSDISNIMFAMEEAGFGKALNDEQREVVYQLSGNANRLRSSLQSFIQNGANEIANSVGVKDVNTVEKEVGIWGGMIRSISSAATNTVKTFYNYLTNYQNQINEQASVNNEELTKLRTDLTKWAKANGIPDNRIFDGILEIDEKGRWNGSFLNKYNKAFRDLKKKYIEDQNIDGLLSILDLDTGKASFNKRLEGFKTWLDNTKFSLNDETNKRIREKKFEDWNYRYNVYDPKYRNTALLYYENNIPGKDIYLSSKWKNLQTNEPLKAAYDYFQSLLKKADRELGMIDNNGKFIPNVENDKLDMWNQYGNASILNLKGLFESFEYKTNNTFGEIDPITGKPKKTVTKLFLNNLGTLKKDEVSGEEFMDFSLKSKDLFSVFSLWGKHMAEYEYMSKLEEVGSLMLTVEELKNSHLQKDKTGKYVPITGNQKNLEYLDDFVNYYVYGQKLKDANAWEFELFNKRYSGKKLVQGVIRYMSMKTLAFNTLSIAANYTGGKFNTFFTATKGKFFNKKHWAGGEYAFSTDKGKAAINFFDIFLEDETFRRSRQLSVFDSVRTLSYDNLFIGQRLSDKAVQYPVLLAMMRSHGIVNDEIVNIREHIQNQNGYSNIFNLPIDQQKALQSKIDAEVTQLESTSSLWELSKIEGTGKTAKLVLPSIDRNSETVLKFRNAVKRANKSILGNATGEDISRYRMTLLGQALGQFRNWMPPLIDQRFSELRYNVDTEEWVQGRARSLFNNYFAATSDQQSINKKALEMLSKHVGALVRDLIGFTNIADIQNRGRQLYLKEKARHAEMDLPFNISEHEFIQLHIENVRAMINELRLILTFTGAIFAVASIPPDDDDQGIARYVTRMMDKFNDELLFYYLPTNATSILQSPIPAVGLLVDVSRFFNNLAGQGYATLTGNEELDSKYKPTRYILKDIPIAKEIYTLGTIFDEDMRRAYEVTR